MLRISDLDVVVEALCSFRCQVRRDGGEARGLHWKLPARAGAPRRPPLATPNYSYEKRQRELAKKRKAEEKRQRKLSGKPDEPDSPDEPQAEGDGAPATDPASPAEPQT